MLRQVKHIAALVAGWLLIAAGVAGLLVPIIPGWALIIPGALLLGFDAACWLRLLDRCERRFPAIARLTQWVRSVVKRESSKAGAAPSQRNG